MEDANITTIKIELYSPPLISKHYKYGNVLKKKKTTHEGSGLLSDIINTNQVGTELNQETTYQPNNYLLNIDDMSNNESYDYKSHEPSESKVNPLLEINDNAINTHGFKKLKRSINNKIFDYSEIKQAEIEGKINELVNTDNYYSEVLPLDVDDEIKNMAPVKFRDSMMGKAIIVGSVVIAWLILMFILF